MKNQHNTKNLGKKKKKTNSKKTLINDNSVQVINQKEYSKNEHTSIENILNTPINKKRLPPIERLQTLDTNEEQKTETKQTNNIEKQTNDLTKQEFIDSIEIDNEKAIMNGKNDIGTGTTFYNINIQELKSEVDNKNNMIAKLSQEQNKYKNILNQLFQKLNQILREKSEILISGDEGEEDKEENLNKLKIHLEQIKRDINSSKNQNKIYKQQYDLLANKDKNANYENYEKKLEKIREENSELLKQIKNLKSQSRLEGKKLENFSFNGKYVSDINKISTELKTLEKKKHENFSKFTENNKFITNCVKEFENLVKFYNSKKANKNYFSAKIEEEINRLREDLSGTEEDIIKRIETDNAFIIKKLIHNEKMKENIFQVPVPKPINANRKINQNERGKSLDPIAKYKISRTKVNSGQSSRINIIARNKSPFTTKTNNINDLKEQDEFKLSKINYNEVTDYEYKDMISKKEHCYDVVTRLEKSIKEAQKMYQRKLKEIKGRVDENEKKLNIKNDENKSLKIEIDNLNKLVSQYEQENKIINEKNIKQKKSINNNYAEKELASQKEYLTPEYNNNTQNNNIKGDKILIQNHSNTDLTRNEILNDLKVLNGQNIDETKLNNLGIKFPDLSNIEENNHLNQNNDTERNRIIDDIKKKYNIKTSDKNNVYIEDNNEDLNNDDLNQEGNQSDIINEEEKIKRDEKLEKEKLEKEIEDEKKFFAEHKDILKNDDEEGQFEPPIQNNIMENNGIKVDNDINEIDDKDVNEEKQMEEDNKENMNKDNRILEESKDIKGENNQLEKKEGDENNDSLEKKDEEDNQIKDNEEKSNLEKMNMNGGDNNMEEDSIDNENQNEINIDDNKTKDIKEKDITNEMNEDDKINDNNNIEENKVDDNKIE